MNTITYSDIFNTYKNAIVTLTTIVDDDKPQTGTGFFINANGYIVTCASNVVNKNRLDVNKVYASVTTGLDTIISETTLIGIDCIGDIAVLKPKKSFPNQPFLSWANSINSSYGDICLVIGNPYGIDSQSISQGIIRDPKYVSIDGLVEVESILISTPTHIGNYGSPIINTNGNVIGILTWRYISNSTSNGNSIRVLIDTISGGPSSYIAKYVCDSLISPTSQNIKKTCIKDLSYFYFNKGYDGILTH
jgi:S1-C subfamily serine protease